MAYLNKILTLLILTLFASPVFAADDYIWEGKYNRELPRAEKGDAKAQYAVGEMYEKGKGTGKDVGKAFDWYWKAAKQGNHKAAYKVGLFYYEGSVVKQDFKEAHSWFTKSAQEEYVRAQYYLGEMYEHGRGVTKNNDTALNWYKRALAGGYSVASDGIQRVTTSEKKKKSFLNRPKNPPNKTVSTRGKILKGGWKKRNRAAEYLPSKITNCKPKRKNIECLSKNITRNIGMADITYTTKAVLFSFTGDNLFKVSYRNKVSKIKITDEEFAESGGKVPVKLGWQDAEHKLSCELENDKSVICKKNKLQTIKLTR